MIDDVLPGLCLNKAEAVLWVRAQLSVGHRAIVAYGSGDSWPTVAAELGAAVVRARPGGYDAPTRPDAGRMAEPAGGAGAEGAAGSATAGDRDVRGRGRLATGTA